MKHAITRLPDLLSRVKMKEAMRETFRPRRREPPLWGVCMRAELIPIAGGPPIPITKDVTVVGRREFCDIQLSDPSLSKRHCVLVKTEGLLIIRDLATTNGTKVKGQLIRWAALLPNDQITIGKLKFRIYLGPDSAAVPVAPKSEKAKRTKEASSKSSTLVPPAPEPARLVAVAPQSAPDDRKGPLLDVDDSRWFDRINSDRMIGEIIDLD